MKTIGILIMAFGLVACEGKRDDHGIEAARIQMLKKACAERDHAEKRLNELSLENANLQLEVADLRTKLQISKSREEFYSQEVDKNHRQKVDEIRQSLRRSLGE